MNRSESGIAPQTPEEYIASLPEDRAEQLSRLRKLVLQHLPEGYVEEIDFGMICYVIPLSTYPETYNGHPLMYAALASQKRHMSIHLMNVYGDEESQRWFADGFAAAGKKLDMGKACVRFKKLDDPSPGRDHRGGFTHASGGLHRRLRGVPGPDGGQAQGTQEPESEVRLLPFCTAPGRPAVPVGGYLCQPKPSK